MFDLEQAIADWRKQMLAAGLQTPVPLEELESHLREELEQQMKTGLTAEAVFPVAIENIGRGNALQNEFKKVKPSKAARNWKFFEAFFAISTLSIPLVAVSQAFYFQSPAFSEMTAGQRFVTLAGSVAFALLAWTTRLSHEKFPVFHTQKIRDAIFVPVLLWLVASIVVVPRCGLTDAQRALLSMWTFAPFGILVGWCWGFATAARNKMAQAGD